MANLKEVKNRIVSVVSTQQITKAMKMVAAAKLRKAQDKITQMRPYASKLDAILKNLSSAQSSGDTDNWYSQVRAEKKILIVAISSDRGLCGSFNSSVFKGVLRVIQEEYNDQFNKGNVTVLSIGKKSAEYFSKRKFECVNQYSTIFTHLSFQEVAAAADFIMTSFRTGKFDKVVVVYN